MRTTVMTVSGPIPLTAVRFVPSRHANVPLNEREQGANRKRSRVEHVFAQQANRLVRSIGQVRAAVKIRMMNLEYNMRRLVWLAG